MTSFSFAISPADITAIAKQIGITSIVTAIDSVSISGSSVVVNFKADLSDADIATLNTVMGSYVYQQPNSPQTDSDGAYLSREKAAPSGYTFQLHCFEVATANNTDGIKNFDSHLVSLNQVTATFFDSSGAVTTDMTQAVKSQFDFEPTYDYYIIGGHMRVVAPPEGDVRMCVICVPDVPAPVGSKVMIDNINLKFLTGDNSINTDGRAAKYLAYNATYHTNKMRFIFNHGAGVSLAVAIGLEFFKP